MPQIQQPQYPTFQRLQQQGVARPPQQGMRYQPPTGNQGQAPGQGSTPGQQPPNQPPSGQQPPQQPPTPYAQAAPQIDTSHPPGSPSTIPPTGIHPPQQQPTGYQANQPPPFQQAPNNPQQNGPQPSMPNLQQMWEKQYGGVQQGNFQGGPQSNYHPGGYQGPGKLDAYQGSNYQLPQVQQQGHFDAPQGGQQVDQRTQQSVMQALGNPSRYGAPEVGAAFDVLNHRLTQQGNADKQMIDEDMASRGIYASTTAGGRLGDLATNLNQQRGDFATNLATDQARNYQTDRASAISQAMGYGGQQFQQGLEGFGANQNAGQQRFLQEQQAGEFGLGQNAQNFGEQLQQHGANQQEGLNKFNSGLDQAQFGLNQNNQNYNQGYTTFGANQQAGQQAYTQRQGAIAGLQNYGQQGFNNQLQTSQFNSDQDYRNNQMILQSLGML